MVKNKKLERCIKKVKKQNKKVNPYAICHSSIGKKFKGHRIIKKNNKIIVRDDIEDIIIKGKLLDIKPRKKKTSNRKRVPFIFR